LPIAPLRDLGSLGVYTDTDPYDNEFRKFTFASNARFEDKRISRGPVFATTGTIALNDTPRFAVSYKQLSGTNQYHIANRDGTITNWSASTLGGASTETDISPVGYVPSTYDPAHTATSLQDVIYVNRADHVPWWKAKNGSQFAALPNVAGLGWDPTWRAGAIREVGGVVVALNVTKGATSYPTMVKTSDFPAFGLPPAQWVGSTSNSATEQIIADLAEPLIDGHPLRDKLILYTENETWAMEPRYDTLMFNYRRLFTASTSSGVINQNCVAEYNNTHYVFGNTDIWIHDGFQRKSLAAGKVRDFVFNNMDKSQTNLCHVIHNPRLTEIMFCYVSADAYCVYPPLSNVGCNRAAVWNYRANTWYFYDLPYTVGGALGVPVTGHCLQRHGKLSPTIPSVAPSRPLVTPTSSPCLIVGVGSASPRGTLTCAVRAFDREGQSALNGILDTIASAPVFIENSGIDLDDLHVELAGYKVVTSIYPEGRFTPDSGALWFSFSAKDYAGAPQNAYETPMAYNGNDYYKLDFRAAGRYLDMRITFADYVNFSLSGLDFVYKKTGSR
jgi:hypothetical protein